MLHKLNIATHRPDPLVVVCAPRCGCATRAGVCVCVCFVVPRHTQSAEKVCVSIQRCGNRTHIDTYLSTYAAVWPTGRWWALTWSTAKHKNEEDGTEKSKKSRDWLDGWWSHQTHNDCVYIFSRFLCRFSALGLHTSAIAFLGGFRLRTYFVGRLIFDIVHNWLHCISWGRCNVELEMTGTHSFRVLTMICISVRWSLLRRAWN